MINATLTLSVGGNKIPIKGIDVGAIRAAITGVVANAVEQSISDAKSEIRTKTPTRKIIDGSTHLRDAYMQSLEAGRFTMDSARGRDVFSLRMFSIPVLDKLLPGNSGKGWWRMHEHGSPNAGRYRLPSWDHFMFVPKKGGGRHGEGIMVDTRGHPNLANRSHPGIKPLHIITNTRNMVLDRMSLLPRLMSNAIGEAVKRGGK